MPRLILSMAEKGRGDARQVAAMLTGVLVFIIGSAPTVVGQTQDDKPGREAHTVVGITAPYREATLAAVQPGRIAQMSAAEGATVQQGELVFALEDGVQRARAEMAEATAESTLDIELAQARQEQAQRDLNRLLKLHGDDDASSKELNDARSAATIARLEYELAKFAHAQAARAHQRELELLEQYHARAPFAGYVVEHLKHVGEAVEESEGVVTLVQLDPLQVLLDCPLSLAPSIQAGAQVTLRPFDTQWSPRQGTVVLANRVADGASQTFRVKVTVPNEDSGWVSGLKVAVEFSPRRVAGPSEGLPRRREDMPAPACGELGDGPRDPQIHR